jgi:hypothetical protein
MEDVSHVLDEKRDIPYPSKERGHENDVSAGALLIRSDR